jgi:hypothetical protein
MAKKRLRRLRDIRCLKFEAKLPLAGHSVCPSCARTHADQNPRPPRLPPRGALRGPLPGAHRQATSRAPAPGAPSASATLRMSRNTPARSFGFRDTMRGWDDTIRQTASSTSDRETAHTSHWL